METKVKLSDAELSRRVRSGEVLMIAEWRQAKIDAVSMTDRKTGAVRRTCVVRHGLETQKEQVSLSEWMPDGTKPESVVIPWAKGQMVLVQVRSLLVERGLLTVGGVMEAL